MKFVQRIPGGVDERIEPITFEFKTTDELIHRDPMSTVKTFDYFEGFYLKRDPSGFNPETKALLMYTTTNGNYFCLGYILGVPEEIDTLKIEEFEKP